MHGQNLFNTILLNLKKINIKKINITDSWVNMFACDQFCAFLIMRALPHFYSLIPLPNNLNQVNTF